MSGFSAAWLDLREPHDRRAFHPGLVRSLAEWAERRTPLTIVDLGAGTGSAMRLLAPLLPSPQQWLLLEKDPELVEAARRRLQGVLPAGVRWRCRVVDLAPDPASPLPDEVSLVVASALLDLVSEAWLERLLLRVRRTGCGLFARLVFDGRIRFRPGDPHDREVVRRVRLHQRRDKGFGPALGTDAAAVLERRLPGAVVRSSDWDLGPDAKAIQEALIRDWAKAALETGDDDADEILSWRDHRLGLVAASRSRLRVGHRDVLWLPG